MSEFESSCKHKVYKQTHIKDFIIEGVKKGQAPAQIVRDVYQVFDKDISLLMVHRTRKRYIKLTGEYLASYKEFQEARNDVLQDFIIERIKNKQPYKKIAEDVQRVFKKDIDNNFISRTRRKYIQLTGESLETYPISKAYRATTSIYEGIRTFVIERIKIGVSPSQITRDVYSVFEKDINAQSVDRIRRWYTKSTGEYLKGYREFHKAATRGKNGR